MPEIQPEASRMIADKPEEEKAAEEAERIRLHNRRVDAYVKYLYRHRGAPLPSRYGVIQIWPRVLLQLPAPPPQPVDPAERLDPKAKKDWNWAEHLAKLAYQQEQEYNRLKKDPQALTEDRLKAANNAFKLYASASMYAEKSGMTEAVKKLNAAFWRMEHEIEKNFLEPEARRKANQKKHAKDIKALQKSFDEAMDNAKPRLEDDERSRAWNRLVLDHLMFKAEAAFAKALEKGLRKVGKKQWNKFRVPIIRTIQKLANEAASPEGWLAKRLENPSVADRDAIRAFIAEAFGLEPDAIPAGWTSMMDELAKAMEEMAKGIRGYLPAGPEVAGLLTGPTEVEMEADEESPSTAMDAAEALARAGERFRNRRAAEAIAQDTALPETGAEGTSDLDGLSGNTAMSVGEPKRGDTIVRRTTFDVEDDEGRNVGFRYYVSGTAIAAASLLIDDKSTYVERLDVDDKYQNMGFGTRILQQLADEYGDVYVAPDNEDAKRLYERIGYDEVGSRAYNESYYAVDEGYGVYSISGDSDTNIVIEGEDDGAGNVALSVGEDGTKGVDPWRVKSGLADFAKEWKSRGGLEYGDERELNAILDGANRFMDTYFGGAIVLSNGGVLRFYPDRRAIERLGLERAWMEYAIHAVTHQKGEGERVRVYSRTKAKTLDDIREIVAADKCVIDKGDLVFIGNNGMSVVAEIVNEDAMRFDEERYITTKFTGSRLRRMAAVPLNTLMAPREGTVKSADMSPSFTSTIANPGADVKPKPGLITIPPANTALSVGDGAYLDAVKRGDLEDARRMAEGRAQEAGYTVPSFHGTGRFGFTVFDPMRTLGGGKRPTSRRTVFFGEQRLAESYSGERGAREIGRPIPKIGIERIRDDASLYEEVRRVADAVGAKVSVRLYGGDVVDAPEDGAPFDTILISLDANGVQDEYELFSISHVMSTMGKAWSVSDAAKSLADEVFWWLDGLKDRNGNYRVALKMENPLTVDAKGESWLRVPLPDGGMGDTHDLAAWALEHGYDGVVIKNVIDNGGKTNKDLDAPMTEHIVFDPEQIKSLDPVTYDDNGNVIPLSQRFNPTNPDIRLSVGSRMGRWDDKRVGTIDRINREALKRDLEMPVPFAGSKRTILNEHPEFFKAVGEAAIRNGGKVIDAFAGAGTYTAGLGQLGALPKGSVLNEWSAARHVMHKMLAERPEAMARAAEKLVTRFANSPEVAEVRRRVAQANKDGQHVVNINQPVIDWFYDELNGKHGTVYVDGTGNTEFGDADLRETPESAALYHVLQSIMSGGFPVNFVWKKGELKIDVAGGNFRSGQVGRIAEKNAKTNVWRIGVSVFNPEHYTKRIRETGRIYREAGVKVTRGDGWALVKTAKRGDVVFVDPAYLGTQSYGGKKSVDANDANDPEIAIGRLVDLVRWADAHGVSVVYTNEFSDKSAMGGMSQEDYARVWEEARERIGADKVRVGYVERGAQGFGKLGGGRADVIFVSGAAMEALDKAREQSGNTALSVGERPGRAPEVRPGGDVREAGESTLAWLRRKFVHSQTPVFDAVRRVMGVGREPPDALNVEAAAKNVHGKIRARQEMLQRAYLEPLKAILAQPGMDRKRFDDYALALHALERNRMIQERSVVVDPTSGEVVDLGLEAGSGVTNAWAERVIREVERDPFAAQYKEAAQILAEMNRFVLRGAVADGLLTEAQARTWMRLSPHYVPLKSGGAAPGAIHKRATGRFTRPDSVLVNSMRQAYATVRNGELNRVNKTMADWIREYDPNGERVGGTVPESHKHAKIKMTDPQYVPKGSTAEALLRERGIRLVETEDKGGYWVDTGVLPQALKRIVRESVPQGDDIVTFWEGGERKFIRFEGKRGRDGEAENEAARIADALNFKNVLHKEGRFWDAIRGLTRWKANVSTSWNPTFIVRNMGADVFNTANLMMIEGKYAELARTMRNYPAALRTIARLHSLRREAGGSKMERMFARCFCAVFCW